jgi:hypothetical protein
MRCATDSHATGKCPKTPASVLRDAVPSGKIGSRLFPFSFIVLGCRDRHNVSEGMFQIPSSRRAS